MPNPHKPEVPSTAQRRIIDFESSCAQSDNTETHARLYRGSGIFSHIGDFTCRSGRPLALTDWILRNGPSRKSGRA